MTDREKFTQVTLRGDDMISRWDNPTEMIAMALGFFVGLSAAVIVMFVLIL